MDYSLLLGIQKGIRQLSTATDGTSFSSSGNFEQGAQAAALDGAETFYFGIIDFLQSWTATETVAMMIKKPVAPQPQSTVPPDDYSLQFIRHFDQKFVGSAHGLPTSGTAGAPATDMVFSSPANQPGQHGQAGFAYGVMSASVGSAVDAQSVQVQFARTDRNDGATDMV